MKNSKIEWTDHTFNPWSGCTKVSPGCAHCYAESLSNRAPKTLAGWGKGVPRKRTSVHNWNDPVRWNRVAELGMFRELYDADGTTVIYRGDMRSKEVPLFEGERKCVQVRPRVFCASLADWLDDEVPIEWLADLLALIQATPHLDWLLLTKRPENWRTRIGLAAVNLTERGMPHRLHHWQAGEAPDNVWIGWSVENKPAADTRAPHGLAIPARVRFLSCEPLLGPVEFSDVTKRSDAVHQLGKKSLDGIHWVIVGGESGHAARPMHPDWARSIRDQCVAVGVPMLFKQWGEWCPGYPVDERTPRVVMGAGVVLGRFGKVAAGRKLDGREWNGFPLLGAASKGGAS